MGSKATGICRRVGPGVRFGPKTERNKLMSEIPRGQSRHALPVQIFRVSAIVQTHADNGMTLNFVQYLYCSAFECSLA